MGRRRRRIIKVVKKKLPTVFSCPSCGEETVKVILTKNKNRAIVQCAACGLKQEISTSPSDQAVDVYCRFTDRFYGVKEPSTSNHETVSVVAPEEQTQPEPPAEIEADNSEHASQEPLQPPEGESTRKEVLEDVSESPQTDESAP